MSLPGGGGVWVGLSFCVRRRDGYGIGVRDKETRKNQIVKNEKLLCMWIRMLASRALRPLTSTSPPARRNTSNTLTVQVQFNKALFLKNHRMLLDTEYCTVFVEQERHGWDRWHHAL